MMRFALVGNQNSGKTTLFNQLTGANQHVGNFPGVTVESKQGELRGHKDAVIVDLPGIYSLSPYTSEEVVTRDFLMNQHPNGILNVVDATNIERNLYLSMQLIELNMPMVIALNMMDEVRSNRGTINISQMQQELGVPVVPISAGRNEGISELIGIAMKTAESKQIPKRQDFCSGAVHRTIHAVAHLVEDHAARIGVPSKFASTRIVEGDVELLEAMDLTDTELSSIENSIREMEDTLGTDRKAAIADMRYTFIDKLCGDTVVKPKESKQQRRSLRIDQVLTNQYLAMPIFFLIMGLIFWLTFGVFGRYFSSLLGNGISWISDMTGNGLDAADFNPVMVSLVMDGIIGGVGSVLSFIPTIVLLFFFLSLLEDSGYMARVAFVMDKLLRKIGLTGRSFVPMLIGFGCSVPAIMAARTLPSERDRKMTILLTPYMSCSAKLPIYGMFTMAFFPRHSALVMICLYVLGILLGVINGLVLNKTIYRGHPVPFIMELPNYRMPSTKTVLMLLWERAKDFLTRAFTIIFVASLVIWFLQTFDMRFNVVTDASDSILADIGRLTAPIFAPLGFADWRVSTALITGFMAKEAVISTFAVLTGASAANLPAALGQIFTPITAFSFLVFTLIYSPCIAAIAATKREMNSAAAALGVVLYQSALAWVIAFIVIQAWNLFI
jgi:ferrous iron transport protein B